MNVPAGIALIVGGGVVGLLGAFVLWPRADHRVAASVVAASGVAVGAGALLIQERVGSAEWIVTLVVLGALAPLHATLVLGRPGRSA